MSNKILSFDAEVNGLWGCVFSVGAVLSENGIETKTFLGRCEIEGDVNPWVAENVIPQLEEVKITHKTKEDLIKGFIKFYMDNKQDAKIIVHMGVPVESNLFKKAHDLGFIGDFDAPYPLLDIAGNLDQAGYDPTSVDNFLKQNDEKIEGNPHNPLFDSRAALKCYQILSLERIAD